MTRAIDRLIVSGAIDPSGRPIARRRSAGCSTGSTRATTSRPQARIRPSSRGGTRASSFASTARRERSAPARARACGAGRRRRTARALRRAAARRRLPSGSSCLRSRLRPTPPLHDVRRLSYSALALFERCSYRYFAERVLRLPRGRRASESSTRSEAGSPEPRSATPFTGCSRRSPSTLRLLRLVPSSRRPCARGTRP